MAEKYRGILPPNSIWYKLDTNRASLILMHAVAEGEIEPTFILTNIFVHKSDPYTELLVPRNQIKMFEQILEEHKEKIIPLY
ncbi:hypothetical protein KJ570_02405 [Patescibacteria group bacterium]|nr:hypothetical protein [Patescibacteria group bacterium]MBU2036235.1 hypothetical protein [Patescibacteria group bacterium]